MAMRALDRPLEQLLEHWHSLPKGPAHIPLKRSFNPARVARLLPIIFIGERRSRHVLITRLAGSDVGGAAGQSLTGVNLFDIYPDSERDFFADFIDGYFNQPCGGRLVRLVTFADGLVYNLETVALPLADRYGNPKYVLGMGQTTANREKSMELVNSRERAVWKPGHIQEVGYFDLGFGVPPLPALPEGVVAE